MEYNKWFQFVTVLLSASAYGYEPKEPYWCLCPPVKRPVCAAGIQFGNGCHVTCENVRRQIYNLPLLKIDCQGLCETCLIGVPEQPNKDTAKESSEEKDDGSQSDVESSEEKDDGNQSDVSSKEEDE